MEINDFVQLFDRFEHSAFRLETLDRYTVEEEEKELTRFVGGEPLPHDPNSEWCGFLKDAAAEGKQVSRVHKLPRRLTPYLRFELEWCYPYSAEAGEEIGLLLPDAREEVRALASEDFWLFDDRQVVAMLYDRDGAFVGVEDRSARLDEYRQIRDAVTANAVPLRDYLASRRAAA